MEKKILEVRGNKYSRSSFDGYLFRVKVLFITTDGEHQLDIYTTDPIQNSVETVLRDRKKEHVKSIKIFHWSTKQQDDNATEMINELLSSN